jgi:hypothetical protein
MVHLPSMPKDATLLDVFRTLPETSRPLLEFHEVLLRGASPLPRVNESSSPRTSPG